MKSSIVFIGIIGILLFVLLVIGMIIVLSKYNRNGQQNNQQVTKTEVIGAKKCPQCGTFADNNSTFCSKCGSKFMQ